MAMHDSSNNSAAPVALGCGATYRQMLHRCTECRTMCRSAHYGARVASKSTAWGGEKSFLPKD
eukprot:6102451-Pleurochrysis_carterae.AAC.1